MAADSWTTLNPGVGGDAVDMQEVTYGGAPVARKRTRTVITGSVAAAIADVTNNPVIAETAYALPVRQAGASVLNSGPASTVYGLPVRLVPRAAHADPLVGGPDVSVGLYTRNNITGFLGGAIAADGDVALFRGDIFGRVFVTHNDPGATKGKAKSYTGVTTGDALWTPASPGFEIAVTALILSCSGTTAGRVTVWFGGSADTTYTEGTDKCVADIEFIPSASKAEYIQMVFGITPVYGGADNRLRVTTSAAINPLRVAAHGYEIGTS